MNSIQQTDHSILELVRQRDESTLTRIYKEVYPMVLKHVTQNSGSKEDAQDVFQDAFYVLIKKTEQPNFNLTSELSTFLVGIAKNVWLKKLTRTSLDVTSYKAELETESEEFSEKEDDNLKKVRHMSFALTELGEPCKSILIQYYFLKQTMQEIAAAFHYTNAENAKNQKYKCLQRLKKLVIKKGE
ncbi:MAG: sigma-70 family RNA polymerase sigma factor [Crocinitomicaceae bacterium]|nr:sigma-70 family RNA polymerase sigma factor [Crocinitomicaceae bacterium]